MGFLSWIPGGVRWFSLAPVEGSLCHTIQFRGSHFWDHLLLVGGEGCRCKVFMKAWTLWSAFSVNRMTSFSEAPEPIVWS